MPQVLQNQMILDSAQTLYFARQLESIKSKTYDVIYAELKAPKMFPVSSDAGSGATKITFTSYDMVGAAQFIANYATDFKRVDISGVQSSSVVKSIGASYGYSLQDIRAAMQANVNLEQRRANTAARATLQLQNTTAFFGDAANNIQGFFDNTNIPKAVVLNDGTLGGTSFASKSPDQIIRDVSALINDIIINTKEVESPDTVLFPTSIWALLKATPRSSLSDTSIAKWLMDNHPQITTWDTLVELETAGPGETAMMVAYAKNADKLELQIPQPFEQFPPQQKGLDYEVICHERIGGLIVYYPLSVNMAYGI